VRRPDAAAGGTLPPMSPPDPADRRALPGCLVNLLAQLGAVAVLFAILLCGAGLGAASAPVTGPFGFMGGMLCFGLSAPVVGLTAGPPPPPGDHEAARPRVRGPRPVAPAVHVVGPRVAR
jgi:hypothetical protein